MIGRTPARAEYSILTLTTLTGINGSPATKAQACSRDCPAGAEERRAPKAHGALQRVARLTPLLHSGPEDIRLRSRFEVRTRGSGRRGDGACLRAR